MRHRKSGVKLNRTTSHRQAMFRNMVTSLLKHDRIKTTEAKAKELRRWADHIVTLAKKGDLHARRMAMAIVREKDVVHKLFEEATDRFGAINGGYTRIIRIGRRTGDAAAMTIIEMISTDGVKPGKPKKSATKVDEKPVEKSSASEKGAAAEQSVTSGSETIPAEDKIDDLAAKTSESKTTSSEVDTVADSAATADPDENTK